MPDPCRSSLGSLFDPRTRLAYHRKGRGIGGGRVYKKSQLLGFCLAIEWAERYEASRPNRERRPARKFFDEKTLLVGDPS